VRSMNKNYKFVVSVLVFSIISIGGMSWSVAPAEAVSSSACNFSRDLQMGVTGTDVLCLQKYLNANGYVISASGAGAPGKETDEFKGLTQAAVIRWQMANKITPASGYFGPKSRQVYQSLLSGSPVTTNTNSPTDTASLQESLLKKIAEIQKQMNSAKENPPVVATKNVTNRLKQVTQDMQEAEDEVADNDDKKGYKNALKELSDARFNFYAVVLAYLAGNTTKVEDLLDEIEQNIEDALDEVDSASNKSSDIEEALEDARDELDNVRDDVEAAEDDGEDMDKALDYLDEAEDLLDEAEEALDDGDEDEAEDLIDEALDLIADAEDEL
jgi:peptidoglycan hydrolase-like protein with peptidoglycan-binding domain